MAVSTSEVRSAMEQWSQSVDAGTPLVASLRGAAGQVQDAQLKTALESVSDDIAQGGLPSVSMAKHGGVFPIEWIPVLRQGEMTGKMDDALRLLF